VTALRNASKRPLAISAIVLAGVIAAGCSSGPGAKKAASAPRITATTSSTPATSTTPPTDATSTTPSATGSGACTSSQLTAAVGNGQGAAGTEIETLVFSNTGASACSLQGYAGVSFVGADGVQLGAPAVRQGSSAPPLVSLAPGQTTSATFAFPDSSNICGNGGTPALGVRVYPPNQTAALFAPFTGAAVCPDSPTGTFTVGPIGAPDNG
jgi:hypothetical protein